MAKRRKNINLKVIDEMPEAPSVIKKWRIRFKYTCPKTRNVEVVERRKTGTVEEARIYRDHLKYHLKGGRDPDEQPMLKEADQIDPDNPDHQPKEDLHPVSGAPTAKTEKGHVRFSEMREIHKKHRAVELDNQKTLTGENNVLKNRVLPEIGDWIVQRVTLRNFQDLRLKWYARHVDVPEDHPDNLSSATINKWLRVMKTFVKWCARRQGVSHPARDLKKLPKPKKKKGRAMSREELESLLGAIKARYPHYYALCYIAAYTGQRFGTLAHLKWADIDTDNDRIKFTHSKTGHKTGVPLDQFRDVLVDHQAVLQSWAPMAARKSPYVFPKRKDPDEDEEQGLRKNTSSINDALKRACKDAGIERVTMHDFRRTFVSLALESGIAPDVIKSFTGHCQSMIGHYHHQSDESKRDLIGTVIGDGAGGGGSQGDGENDENNPSDSILTATDVALG